MNGGRPTAEQRRVVVERARERCEYCLMPQSLVASAHQVDHIIANKHGGATSENNLALSCSLCNLRKGSDISSFDPKTRSLTPLFNPREQSWHDHFRFKRDEIEGVTSVGRTTVHFLRLNSIERITERIELAKAGIVLDSHLAKKPR